MRNNTARSGQPRSVPAKHPAILAGRIGYEEARKGLPLDYDRYASQGEQASYEIGRLWALNMKAAGLDLPAWPKGRHVPAALDASLSLSFVMVGGCQPGRDDGRDYPGCRLEQAAA